MTRSGHKLNYHTYSARAHFHWTKWIVLFSLVLLLAAAGIGFYVSLPTLRHRWFEQRCLLYEPDPNVAVFDSRPSALANLHRSDPAWSSGSISVYDLSGVARAIPYVMFTPRELVRFDPAIQPKAVAFMHLRMSPGGNRRLVIVEAIPVSGLTYSVIDPNSGAIPSTSNFVSDPIHSTAGMGMLDSKEVAVFSGRRDTAHPEHFTIPYRAGNDNFTVDCYLQDDNSIRMVDTGLNPMSQPSAASSR